MQVKESHISRTNGPDCAGDNRSGGKYTAKFLFLQKNPHPAFGVSGARIGTIIGIITGFFNYFFLFLHQ